MDKADTEVAARWCCGVVFLKLSQNSQENTFVRIEFVTFVFFNKVAGLKSVTLLKRDSDTGVFCEFREIRTPF